MGALLLLIALVTGALVFIRPSDLLRDLTWGQLFIPFAGDGRWLTPIGAVAMGAALLFLVRCVTARRPLVDLRSWWRSMREADLLGAVYLAVALGGVILAFATADPAVELFADQGWWYLAASLVSSVAFVVHIRGAERPLVPARDAAAHARLGLGPGQLLRRSRPDRRRGRHPAVRAHHDLPRLPARRRAGAGAVPARAPGRRGGRAATSPAGSAPGW